MTVDEIVITTCPGQSQPGLHLPMDRHWLVYFARSKFTLCILLYTQFTPHKLAPELPRRPAQFCSISQNN